jgi:hypothetical protein
LIAEAVHVAAVRALPGNVIAGHAPYVFLHTGLAYLESAPAMPAKRIGQATAMTLLQGGTPPASPALFFTAVVHMCK